MILTCYYCQGKGQVKTPYNSPYIETIYSDCLGCNGKGKFKLHFKDFFSVSDLKNILSSEEYRKQLKIKPATKVAQGQYFVDELQKFIEGLKE